MTLQQWPNVKALNMVFSKLTCLCFQWYTASCHPFTVHEICSYGNEHTEEISRRGSSACCPRERDGAPTKIHQERFFI
jgi:hypothetical protein